MKFKDDFAELALILALFVIASLCLIAGAWFIPLLLIRLLFGG